MYSYTFAHAAIQPNLSRSILSQYQILDDFRLSTVIQPCSRPQNRGCKKPVGAYLEVHRYCAPTFGSLNQKFGCDLETILKDLL